MDYGILTNKDKRIYFAKQFFPKFEINLIWKVFV